jgi:acyl-CoA synthetase (NDP forming)
MFKPRSVALVGASSNPAKLSHVALKNMKGGRFELYPVNPKADRILGLKCYPSVLDIPGQVDLAVISLPAELSIDPLKECVEKGAKVAIVTSSGFREIGPAGAKLERALMDAVIGTDTRILGPNTMGLFVPSIGLDTYFISKDRSSRPDAGPIAMLSQSGAVSVSFLERAKESGIGISACVGLGNKCDINENDLLAYLHRHAPTRCIAMYLESITDGHRLVELAQGISKTKPIVVLKSGRTGTGARAATSHTGALAAATDAVVKGAFRQSGILRAYDEEELMDLAKVLTCVGSINGDRICVIASAGGYGVIATDLVESGERGAGMHMASLSANTSEAIGRLIPDYGSATNPVDLTAAVTDEMYEGVLKALQRDDNVDGIMMSLELQPPFITRRLIQIAEKRASARGAPIIVCAFGGEGTGAMLRELEKRMVPAYPTLWRSVRALRALAERGAYLKRVK